VRTARRVGRGDYIAFVSTSDHVLRYASPEGGPLRWDDPTDVAAHVQP
jgi:hypothetical protein